MGLVVIALWAISSFLAVTTLASMMRRKQTFLAELLLDYTHRTVEKQLMWERRKAKAEALAKHQAQMLEVRHSLKKPS